MTDIFYMGILASFAGFVIWRQQEQIKDLTRKVIARNAVELIGLEEGAEIRTISASDADWSDNGGNGRIN